MVEETISVAVEGGMKIGHFTLSVVDLAIPLSGLDVSVLRIYDSRDRRQGDFGFGWRLAIRQGSYRNNRPPGDGWQIHSGILPCEVPQETKSHLTTVRLSDPEVYRFRLRITDLAPTIGECFARAVFEYVDGPSPGSTLELLGNDQVFWDGAGDQLIDTETLELFEPDDVQLTTRDVRVFHLDLQDGVTHLEDPNGNALDISLEGITHSTGHGVDFERDSEGRIAKIVDPLGREILYSYDPLGDLVAVTDRTGATSRFTYAPDHFLEEVENALGVRATRTEYDDEGRIARIIDAAGNAVHFEHDLAARREVVTDRLGFVRVVEYDRRGNAVREIDENGKIVTRTFDGRDNPLTITDPLGNTITNVFSPAGDLLSTTDPLGTSPASPTTPAAGS